MTCGKQNTVKEVIYAGGEVRVFYGQTIYWVLNLQMHNLPHSSFDYDMRWGILHGFKLNV